MRIVAKSSSHAWLTAGVCAQVFVDFFAEWCGPCKMVAPKLEQLSQQYPHVTFVKIDVDECQVRPRILCVVTAKSTAPRCTAR